MFYKTIRFPISFENNIASGVKTHAIFKAKHDLQCHTRLMKSHTQSKKSQMV